MPLRQLSPTDLYGLASELQNKELDPNSDIFIQALRFPKKLEMLRDNVNVPEITSDDDPTIDLIAGLLALFIQSGLLQALFKKKSKKA